ncbi:flagellar hook-length control protein FliK [Niveibacterium sp.]|uniref:flagellar hook-length control protein FliK n=1 Tax=Niveibacterium sp. TaxID=2017444 RepID=UPI0035B408F7
MPAINVTPSPMPAPVSNSPVQASQATNAADSGADNGKQANFANALDGAKAKTQQADDSKGSERTASEDAAAVDDPARLAQIAAALLESLGAPMADQPKSFDDQLSKVDDRGLVAALNASNLVAVEGRKPGESAAQADTPYPPATGETLPLDGKALPATAVPAAQAGDGKAGADADSDGADKAAANALLAQTANRTTTTSNDDKANPAVTALGDTAKQPVTAAVVETTGKAAQTKAIITDAALQTNTAAQPAVSPWSEALAQRSSEAARAEAPQFPVRTPVSQSGWADDVGNRMVWMAGKELGRAELILTPPHLGRVEITLNVNGDQTTAHFVTATPAAREAIEQSLPRLRELMTDAGLNLSQVNVSANGANDSPQEQRNWGGSQRGGRQQLADEAPDMAAQSRPAWTRSGLGMVDTFA